MENDVQALINLLDEFHAKPSPPGMEWAQDNWYNIQAIVHRVSTLRAGVRARKGKGKPIVCSILGAALITAVNHKVQQQKSHTEVVNSLQDLVKSLQTQLEEQKTTVNILQEEIRNEKVTTRVLREELYARIMKEGKKETELESSKEIYPISDLKPLRDQVEKQAIALRPLIKTEYTYEGSDDDTPQITTKEIPYTATELAKLKKEYSRTPKESETEYVWRVSLTGGDQILLSEKEAEGFWGAGVFLTTGDNRAPWSITQRAAYWAEGLSPLERGDPLAIVGNVNQIVESVQKAACLQMMHDRELTPRRESPMMLPVNPERMIPLIRGLPESLKPIGIQLKGQIESLTKEERAAATLEAALSPGAYRRENKNKIWTWGVVGQELINYGRKYGPVPSVTTDSKSIRRTECKTTIPPVKLRKVTFSPGQGAPTNTGTHREKRNTLWIAGLQKGIPKSLMDGQPTDKLEILIQEWSAKGVSLKAATTPPLEELKIEEVTGNSSLHPQ
ncbi:uncharacterized protein [Pithys albifrons albifrons]|uniref:uncharacterized protein n=1 Tax=Pithys albifrons albifrons TaxID=3385563 RepID=UPI003A5CFFE3